MDRVDGVSEVAPGVGIHNEGQEGAMLGSPSRGLNAELRGDQRPLADAAVWRGALLWALALYVPLSAPLGRLEASLETSSIPETWRQGVLILSSLLLALAIGLITQLGCSWALGPGWASSLGVVVFGWSLLLTLTSRDSN